MLAIEDLKTARTVDMRGPVVTLPDFVTAEWMHREMALLPRMLRSATVGRKEIARISGFQEWPEHVPEDGQWEQLLAKGMRYPFFLRAFFREALRIGIPNAAKRESYIAFRQLYTALVGIPINRKATRRTARKPRIPRPKPVHMKRAAMEMTAQDDRTPIHAIRDVLAYDPKKAAQFAWISAFLFSGIDHDALADLVREEQEAFGKVAGLILEVCELLRAYPLDWMKEIVEYGATAPWMPAGEPETPDHELATAKHGIEDDEDDVWAEHNNPKDTTTLASEDMAGGCAARVCATGTADLPVATVLNPTPLDAPLEGGDIEDGWKRELQRMIALATAMERIAPDADAVGQAAEIVATLKGYAAAWSELHPPIVEITPLIDRMRAILPRLLALGKTSGDDAALGALIDGAPSHVDRLVSVTADEVATRAEANVEEAEKAYAAAQEARHGIADIDELFAALLPINARLKEARSAGFGAVREVIGILEGAPAASAPQAVSEQPETEPAPAPEASPKQEEDVDDTAGDAPGEHPQRDTSSLSAEAQSGTREAVADLDPEAASFIAEPSSREESTLADIGAEPELDDVWHPEVEDGAITGAAIQAQAELDAVTAAVRAERAADALATTNGHDVEFDDGAALVEPMAGLITERMLDLFKVGEFGAAYHLRRAAGMTMPGAEFPFSAAELRLAATAGIGHGLSHAEVQRQGAMFDEAAGVAQELTGSGTPATDLVVARRIALFASLIEPALFSSITHRSLQTTIDVLVKNGVGNCFFDLAQAVARNRSAGFPLTVSNLYAQSPASSGHHIEEIRRHVADKANVIANGRWDFRAARAVRNWLCAKSGHVGRLLAAMLCGEGLPEARELIKVSLDHQKADDLISVAEEESGAAELYGDVRERFIANLTELASLCQAWVEAAAAMEGGGPREKVLRDLGVIVVTGADHARQELKALARQHGPIVAAAVALAESVLTRLKSIALGEEAPKIEPGRHFVDLHGPLLWIPGLLYAGGWVPSPYQPDLIVEAILNGLPPSLAQRSTEVAVREAVAARIKEGSFIAARLLVNAAGWYGLSRSVLKELSDRINADMDTRRDEVKETLKAAEREIMRAKRFSPMGAENLDDLEQRLKEVDTSRLPNDIDAAAPEGGDAERLLDFAAVERRIADIRDRIASLLAEPREVMRTRLEAVCAGLPPDRAEALCKSIDNLLDIADLATAQEMLDHIENDGADASDGMIRPSAFAEYFPAVPNSLPETDYSLDDIAEAIEKGENFRGLPFSTIEEPEEARKLLRLWRDFRQVVRGRGGNVASVLANATSMLTSFGIRCDMNGKIDTEKSNDRKALFVGDVTLRFDAGNSLLLPDFGSKTQGAWRLCVTERIPELGALTALCRDSGHVGVLVLIAGVVSARQREEAAIRLMAEGGKLLIIDETLFLYALSQRRFRPLSMVEVAQAFSAADPYEDSGNAAVPPEMFVGRSEELRKIVGLDSGFLVYGGRRLGKTALLRYVQSREHEPANERVCVYVSLYETEAKSIWQLASSHMPDIFPQGRELHDGKTFCDRVAKWLEDNPKRRLLLLVDEANTFVSEDGNKQFETFRQLQGLMSRTGRRFKVVMAGLQNIARMVRNSENSPISHIDRDVLRIGPLMGRDAADAETLVTQPLSGMGVTFASRDDVWRILSACNYYPVLIQLFCKNLVRTLRNEASTNKRIVRVVDSETVSKVLEDPDAQKDIKEAFDKTLKLDQGRYELLTYVVAQHVIERETAGLSDDGLTARTVRAQAGTFWKEAFGDGVMTDEDVAGLLDEMEGLGLLRKISERTWTLRSRSILRFLGGVEGVSDGLLAFDGKSAPKVFDPRVKRRFLEPPSKDKDSVRSPLTTGQEYDLLRSDGEPVRLVFGLPFAGLDKAADALKSAPVGMGSAGLEVEFARSRNLGAFVKELSSLKASDERRKVVVVPTQCKWTVEWVQKAMAATAIRSGRAHAVFIGGPEEAAAWVNSDIGRRLSKVPVHTLMPWRLMMTETLLNQSQILDPATRAAEIHALTGGWNVPMCTVFPDDTVSKTRLESNLRRARDKVADASVAADLGLSHAYGAALASIVDYMLNDRRVTLEDLSEALSGRVGLKAHQVLDYALLLGLVETTAEKGSQSTSDARRPHELNALVFSALRRGKETRP